MLSYFCVNEAAMLPIADLARNICLLDSDCMQRLFLLLKTGSDFRTQTIFLVLQL